MNRTMVLLALGVFCIGHASAAIWYVNSANVSGVEDGLTWASAFTTIQDAIDAATVDDEVRVAQGVYADSGNSGAGSLDMKNTVNLYGGYSGSGTTRDPEVYETVISGANGRGQNMPANITIEGAAGSILDGFTIESNAPSHFNGLALRLMDAASALYSAMGVYNCNFRHEPNIRKIGHSVYLRNSAAIRDCSFEAHESNFTHGAIDAAGGAFTISDCDFLLSADVQVQHSEVTMFGNRFEGRVDVDNCTLVVQDCDFIGSPSVIDSAAVVSRCAFSRGLHCSNSQLQLAESTFESEEAGGAFSSQGSIVEVRDCAFRNYESNADFGGYAFRSDYDVGLSIARSVFASASGNKSPALYTRGTGTATLSDCRFESNFSEGIAGAVEIRECGEAAIENTVFYGNEALAQGGAVYVTFTPTKIANCIFAGNIAGGTGSALYVAASDVEVSNSAFWRNSSPAIQTAGPSAVRVTYSLVEGGYPGVGNFSADPLFRNGATGDFRLRSASPLIDAGTTVPSPVADVRGIARPKGAAFDIGIYEFEDSDGDGMEDAWEAQYGLDPNDPLDAGDDGDSDGLTNLDEFDLDTDPTTPTTIPSDYYVATDGNDAAGDGSENNPWRTIAFAMNEAGLVAPYIGGATIHLAPGLYVEPVRLMPDVTLMGDSASTTTIRYFNAADDDHIVVRGANGSALKQVRVGLPALHPDVTVLVQIEDVAMEIDQCILDGGDNLFSIGALVSGTGSSASVIHNNTIRRLQYGIQAVNSAVNITENVFEAIRGDAVFVELPAKRKQGDPAATPVLGEAGNASTGFNRFKSVAGNFVLNLSGLETAAELNDWGVYSQSQIAAKMAGDVDFMPFLGRDGTVPVEPEAAFSATPTAGTAPLTVQFMDASDPGSLDITAWTWNFGDPESGASNLSSLANPTHTFAQPGRYTVTLTVQTGVGESTAMMTDLVEVTAAQGPRANFTVNPSVGYAPLTVQFTDTSSAGTATITSWDWDFGDPLSGADNASTEQNPVHVYAQPGIYFVKLEIETGQGADTAFRSAVVVQSPSGPAASFTAEPREGSAPLEVQFTDTSVAGTAPIDSWLWAFDDPDSGEANTSTEQNPTHEFTTPGLYTITLTVTTEHGTDERTEFAYVTVTEAPRCGAQGKLEYAAAGVFLLVFDRVSRRRRKQPDTH